MIHTCPRCGGDTKKRSGISYCFRCELPLGIMPINVTQNLTSSGRRQPIFHRENEGYIKIKTRNTTRYELNFD